MGKKPAVKVAKGTRDFMPDQMTIREDLFERITRVFKQHGAVTIDTPVFELKETLTEKYGEDSKLIYDLADQGGEILALRYDLTVPFARYVAFHGIQNIKRYAIGKVYRRDNPAMARGRFREFFQCDFDVAGAYPEGVADSEALAVMGEVLDALDLREHEIKLSHRGLLDGLLASAGVPEDKRRAACSAIDKLDKEPWEVVRREMVETKGIDEAVADAIEPLVKQRGEPKALLEALFATDLDGRPAPLALEPRALAARDELAKIFAYLEAMGGLDRVVLDLSLARGLDYYTGVIYEATLPGAGVGSVAAGGRYDELVGSFSPRPVPAVGCSIGVERLYNILEERAREAAKAADRPIRETSTDVLVASIGNNLQARRMEVAASLWRAGIAAEFGYKTNPKMGDQISYALKQGIPYLVLFGETELEKDELKIKSLAANTQETVPRAALVERLRNLLAGGKDGAGVAARSTDGPTPAISGLALSS